MSTMMKDFDEKTDESSSVTGSAQAPEISWPTGVQSFVTAGMKRKIAYDGARLQIWFEERSSRRQFFKSWANDEDCCEIDKTCLQKSELSELLVEAFTCPPNDEIKVESKVGDHSVSLSVDWKPSKFMKRSFLIEVPERPISSIERLGARLEDVEAALATKTAADLSDWTLHLSLPHHDYSDSQAHSAKYFLLQDSDFMTKSTGISTADTGNGWIQASFRQPVFVRNIKFAPFRKHDSIISSSELCIQVQSLDDGTWRVHTTLPAESVTEHIIDLNCKTLAVRLSGEYVSISKLIFT